MGAAVESQIIVKGVAVNYKKYGRGPVVLLLHGWGDSLDTFDRLVSDLGRVFTCVRIDLPGFGRSEAPHYAYTLDDYALNIEECLQKIGITELYALIGHSFGGAVSVKIAGKSRMKVKKIVLLASSGIRNNLTVKKIFMWPIAKIVKSVLLLLPHKIRQKIKKRVYTMIGSDIYVAENMKQTFKKIISEDMRDDASKIGQPVLMLYGSEDNSTPVRHGEIFQQAIQHATLEVIDGAGHFIHHDAADQVASRIRYFLT